MLEIDAIDLTAPRPADGGLAETWALLSGQTRAFAARPPQAWPHPHARPHPHPPSSPSSPPAAAEACAAEIHCVSMPVSVLDDPPRGAVVLALGDRDARTLAAAMLGQAAGEITPEDLADVCREACNVLSSCVIRRYAQARELTLGLPSLVPPATLPRLAAAGAVLDLFESRHDGQAMQVAVVSEAPLSLPESTS